MTKQVLVKGIEYTLPETLEVIEVNGDHYEVSVGTDPDLIRALSILNNGRQTRVTIEYGDTKTGEFWGDAETGYIGRSMGPLYLFILPWDKRSLGGGAIITGSVLRIRYANKKQGGVIYEHPSVKGE